MMFKQHHATENDGVAHIMRRFFRGLETRDPAEVALRYSQHLHESNLEQLLTEKRTALGSRYYVGLSCAEQDFETLTKRTSLVANSLLLSHGHDGPYTEFRQTSDHRESSNEVDFISVYEANSKLTSTTGVGVRCSDIQVVGEWILAARELLCAGLAWYLPSYARARHTLRAGSELTPDLTLERLTRGPDPVDYLIRDRCAVDASGAEAIKGRLVRPILRIDLPYVDGVGLRDFSKITVGEFDGYRVEIEEQILKTAAEMRKRQRKGAIATLGAGLGTVSAALVAVSGPALEKALPVLGVSGGIWALINAISDHRAKNVTEGKWYYVWLLGQARNG